MIVYPAIDIYQGRAVRMTRGDFATVEEVAPSPLDAARKLVAEGAEWLHIVGRRSPRRAPRGSWWARQPSRTPSSSAGLSIGTPTGSPSRSTRASGW
ncbi:MAG: hypothetical protein E6I64_03960 [Chloroflexi bacterium]|nr:MAG: hypothetical protein E6I64_03960 [Chloroflexota bacterium]